MMATIKNSFDPLWFMGCVYECRICEKKYFTSDFELFEHVINIHKSNISSHFKSISDLETNLVKFKCQICGNDQIKKSPYHVRSHLEGFHALSMLDYEKIYLLPKHNTEQVQVSNLRLTKNNTENQEAKVSNLWKEFEEEFLEEEYVDETTETKPSNAKNVVTLFVKDGKYSANDMSTDDNYKSLDDFANNNNVKTGMPKIETENLISALSKTMEVFVRNSNNVEQNPKESIQNLDLETNHKKIQLIEKVKHKIDKSIRKRKKKLKTDANSNIEESIKEINKQPKIKTNSNNEDHDNFKRKRSAAYKKKFKSGIKTCFDCKNSFNTKEELIQHQETEHADKRKFKCEFCPKRFKEKNHKETHEGIHKGIRPFKCDFCGKDFRLKMHKETHEGIHKGLRPFKCDYCGKDFRLRDHFKRHMTNVHKNPMLST